MGGQVEVYAPKLKCPTLVSVGLVGVPAQGDSHERRNPWWTSRYSCRARERLTLVSG
ncbi:uncharacterized protein METZ01_LOCUS75927 [marine metagenome]|uniref:Uncharacterized protein n=1 Tax=marine metagenome TaxID=408172 RepID=A0A381U914_9ZZZZ